MSLWTMENDKSIEEMIKLIGVLTHKTKSELLIRKYGRQSRSPHRAFAMYACHYYWQVTHKVIAKYFGLKPAGSVCYPLNKLKK
jgi:hypothetical protein